MGMYCPYCHTRVSHKWHIKYVFCSDYCRTQFINKFQKVKLPHAFGDTKSKVKKRRRKHIELYNKFHNPTSLINNSVDSTPKELDKSVQSCCQSLEGK
jgi:hypothetical protein